MFFVKDRAAEQKSVVFKIVVWGNCYTLALGIEKNLIQSHLPFRFLGTWKEGRFYLFFSCPTANFWPLLGGQSLSPNVTHCVLTYFDYPGQASTGVWISLSFWFDWNSLTNWSLPLVCNFMLWLRNFFDLPIRASMYLVVWTEFWELIYLQEGFVKWIAWYTERDLYLERLSKG